MDRDTDAIRILGQVQQCVNETWAQQADTQTATRMMRLFSTVADICSTIGFFKHAVNFRQLSLDMVQPAPTVSLELKDLALDLAASGQLQAAFERFQNLLREALKSFRKILAREVKGEDCFRHFEIEGYIGVLHLGLGRPKKALDMIIEALSMMEETEENLFNLQVLEYAKDHIQRHCSPHSGACPAESHVRIVRALFIGLRRPSWGKPIADVLPLLFKKIDEEASLEAQNRLESPTRVLRSSSLD
ncbi:MAG: hypothetical protein Q9220_005994 [cf. Caloplaca sp. 1 TL-2023]